MIPLSNEDQYYRDAFEVKYERIKEIMAGDPDYDEVQARQIAAEYASRFSGGSAVSIPGGGNAGGQA